MTLGQFLMLYLLAGCAVAAAVYLCLSARGPSERVLQVATALVFWPFFLTLLLSRTRTRRSGDGSHSAESLDLTITSVHAELVSALGGMDGFADGAVPQQRDRLNELRMAWVAQAARIREMDRLLSEVERDADEPLEDGASQRVQATREAVRQRVHELRQIRDQAHASLAQTLALVRELVSMIHLARFADTPSARAQELLAEIAAVTQDMCNQGSTAGHVTLACDKRGCSPAGPARGG
jgi:hypothetical protein